MTFRRSRPTAPGLFSARTTAAIAASGLVAAALLAGSASADAAFWGMEGHEMVAAAAATGLPSDMPAFFREAAPQLRWLNPEPDRWRGSESPEMDEAYKYDHYVDLENLPPGALQAEDRYEFLKVLHEAGLEEPEVAAGFLPFRIVELYQRVENGFRRWRAATSDQERRWIEERIINDAGILGHYVADAANPQHTTIHFNGWDRDTPNPEGFTTDDDFHWRFESQFVQAHITPAEVMARTPAGARALPDMRAAVLEYIGATHQHVVSLYRLDRDVGFSPDRGDPRAEAFALDRLAAGASMLRDVWYSAWVASAVPRDR